MGTRKKLELSGQVFNLLTVLHRSETNPRKWVCQCECGNICETTPSNLRNGKPKSCGCLATKQRKERFTLHGAASGGKNTPEYQSYTAMIHRCYNERRIGWNRYGGRGIIVSEESWLEESPAGFLNFLQDMGERPKGATLDRINPDGNYCKENCRWASRRLQSYNVTKKK